MSTTDAKNTSPRIPVGHRGAAESYLARYRSVVAGTRGGPGMVARCARFASPIETTLTVAAALFEATGTSRCEWQSRSATAALSVACVAFGFALVVAAHPAPVKAVLAGVTSVVALFVTMSLSSADESAAVTWAQRAQTTMFVAAAVGTVSSFVTVVTWWLRRRAARPSSSDAAPMEMASGAPLLSEPVVAAPIPSPAGTDGVARHVNPLLLGGSQPLSASDRGGGGKQEGRTHQPIH